MASHPKTASPPSPLTPLAVREVWQTLAHRVEALTHSKLLPWCLIPVLPILMAALEWIRFYRHTAPSPWTFSLLALAGAGLAALMIRRALLGAAQPKRDAERTVGETLEALAAADARVFQNVPTSAGVDIDHVVIAPGGIFTIAVENPPKPARKRPRVVVDRSGLAIAGAPAASDVLDRASAQASWLAEHLHRNMGRSVHVRAVVLFPGWRVEQKTPRKTQDAWAMEPEAFLKSVQRGPAMLTAEQVAAAATCVSEHTEALRAGFTGIFGPLRGRIQG
jgi:Nuclease-related domain